MRLPRLSALLLATVATPLVAVIACGGASSNPDVTGLPGSSSGTSSGNGSATSGGEFDAAGPLPIVSFTGVTPCGSPVDAGWQDWSECALSMPVSGGVSGYIDVPNLLVVCGDGLSSGTLDSMSWTTNAGGGVAVSVQATLTSGTPLDHTGAFPATVEITVTLPDASALSWKTPDGACSITIAGSMCVETSGNQTDAAAREERILSGTGSCTKPAAPEPGTAASPVTIGAFPFLETIAP